MKKSIFYKLFGIGKINKKNMAIFESEGIELIDEGVSGSITFKNFKAPGKRFGWRRQWYVGSIVLTKNRIIGLRGNKSVIDVPLTDDRLKEMEFSIDQNSILKVSVNAGLFQDNWAGLLEFRFKSDIGKEFIKKLV